MIRLFLKNLKPHDNDEREGGRGGEGHRARSVEERKERTEEGGEREIGRGEWKRG